MWEIIEWDEIVNLALNARHAWMDKWTSTCVLAESFVFSPLLGGRDEEFQNKEHSLGDGYHSLLQCLFGEWSLR